MQPIKSKHCNDVLRAPPGEEDACSDLHILRSVEPYGAVEVPCVASFWQPSEEELANLLAGHGVMLMFVGMTHPPVWVRVVEI